MPDAPDQLAAVLADAWCRLDEAAGDGSHPLAQPVLATADADGSPHARVVILRQFDRDHRRLIGHTDARSPKAGQLRDRPVATWLHWDPQARVQLRLVTAVTLHQDDELADGQWAGASASSRRAYLAPHPPSSPVAGSEPSLNLPADVQGEVPDEDRLAAGRDHFLVVAGVIERLDVLYLIDGGQRRARFRWAGDGEPDAMWVHP
jgi:hypothetical protein